MKCSKCDTENLLKANYCKNCGQAFTRREKETARKKALVGKIEKTGEAVDKYEKVKGLLTLNFLTENPYVKIALLLLPLLFSMLFGGGVNTDSILFLNSNDYEVYYNTDTDEYFLDLTDESAKLKVSVPSDTDYIVLFYTSPYGGMEDATTYELNENIVVRYQEGGKYELKAVTDSGDISAIFYTV